jgi:hypothetical protein
LEATRIISSSMEITKLLLGKRTPVPAMTVIAVWLHLRPLRRIRRSRHSRDRGHHRGQVVDAISIRETPAEVEDRAVPGHWEGDLLRGAQLLIASRDACKPAIICIAPMSAELISWSFIFATRCCSVAFFRAPHGRESHLRTPSGA